MLMSIQKMRDSQSAFVNSAYFDDEHTERIIKSINNRKSLVFKPDSTINEAESVESSLETNGMIQQDIDEGSYAKSKTKTARNN